MERRTTENYTLSRSQDRPAPAKGCPRSSQATEPTERPLYALPAIRIVDSWLHEQRDRVAKRMEQEYWEALDATFTEAERAEADSKALLFVAESWLSDNNTKVDPLIGKIKSQVVRNMNFRSDIIAIADSVCPPARADRARTDNRTGITAAVTCLREATQAFEAQTQLFADALFKKTQKIEEPAQTNLLQSEVERLTQFIRSRLHSWAQRARGQVSQLSGSSHEIILLYLTICNLSIWNYLQIVKIIVLARPVWSSLTNCASSADKMESNPL